MTALCWCGRKWKPCCSILITAGNKQSSSSPHQARPQRRKRGTSPGKTTLWRWRSWLRNEARIQSAYRSPSLLSTSIHRQTGRGASRVKKRRRRRRSHTHTDTQRTQANTNTRTHVFSLQIAVWCLHCQRGQQDCWHRSVVLFCSETSTLSCLSLFKRMAVCSSVCVCVCTCGGQTTLLRSNCLLLIILAALLLRFCCIERLQRHAQRM